jgi:MYXO-CTERM domain-containing protein
MKRVFGILIVAAIATPASAQVVDGTKDAGYGAALAVQTVDTQFGDANPNGGSELDAGYALISGGRLNLMLTGNIEANFNKLEIFIDSKAGGQSVFDSSGNDGAGAMDGLVFDAGFTADYHIIVRRGNDQGNDKLDIDFANLVAQSASGYLDVIGGSTGAGSTGTGVNASPIDVAYDNSNTAGVGGGTGAANQAAAAAVTTGLELSIALSDLGYAGGQICIMAGQNNQGHNFWSNQFLGGLPQGLMNGGGAGTGTGNLGGDGNGNFNGSGAVNMTNFAGDQFFCVVPEPTSGLLAGLAGLVMAAVARRRAA